MGRAYGRRVKTLIALTVLLVTIVQPAIATVAIFAGTESREETYFAYKNATIRQTYQGKVYFLYEVETGRSVEIQLLSQGFYREHSVRSERNLFSLVTPRNRLASASPFTWETILIDAKRENVNGRTTVESVTWQGMVSSPLSEPTGIEAATGLPRSFPKTLVSRQALADEEMIGADGSGHRMRYRVSSTASLQLAPTKASNTAGETFEAAILRVREIVRKAGYP